MRVRSRTSTPSGWRGAAILSLAAATASCRVANAPRPGATGDEIPLTLENIYRVGGGAGGVAISPDGVMLAVSGQGPDGGGIYAQPADGSAPTLWVRGGGQTWSPSGDRLAFTSGGALSVVDRGSTEPRVVAEGLAGTRAPAWSPDGSTIAFYSTESGFQDIWLVAADGSTEPRRLTESAAEADDSRFTPAWSPDGRWIAYVSNEADWWHDDVWIVRTADGRRFKVSSRLMASSSPVWSPTRPQLVLMGTAKDEYWYEDLSYLYLVELDLGGDRPRVVREAPIDMQVWASDFIMRFDPFWSGDGDRVFFPYQERGAFDLWVVPAVGGVATRVTNVGGVWSSLHATPDGSRAVFSRDAPLEGREAWIVDASGGPARRVTSFSPRFADLQRPVEISFPTFDDLFIQGFLYLPPVIRDAVGGGEGAGASGLALGSAAGRALATYDGPSCPALVQVHGGGTNSYYQGTNLTEQYLASRGFVVLAINYRGGSGFGRSFQDLSIEDWLNDQSKDPGAAADWLREQPWVNDRVGIYGGSYGGMQSMSAITRTPDKFDAAVPMRGIYSEALTLPYADRLGKIFTITGHGGTPEGRPEIYAKSETLDRMEAITAPVLIMHGEEDVRAPFENFRLAVERLTELGKEFESMTYPEGHGFRDPANSIDMYSRLEEFFRRHLGECR
ncbi:MAG: prolyl oligopeptidase family serine peptidase [Gemmatimonadota bacterium]|nr:prolyl oligopeptidase family serine peptidase [Gemmatimonadota bacterium]